MPKYSITNAILRRFDSPEVNMLKILICAGLFFFAYTQAKKGTPKNFLLAIVSGVMGIFVLLGILGHVFFVFSMSFLAIVVVVAALLFFLTQRSGQQSSA